MKEFLYLPEEIQGIFFGNVSLNVELFDYL